MQYDETLNSIKSVRNRIKDEHPDLYKHLASIPEPLESKEGKGVSKKILKDYLATISQLLSMHRRKRYLQIS